MLEFKKTKVEAKIYGEVYNLRRPSVKEAQDFGKKAKTTSEEKTAEVLVKLLSDCGLPSEVALEMEVGHLTELVGALMPSKGK